MKCLLNVIQERLLNFKVCLDNNFDRVIQNMINNTCCKIDKIVEDFDTNCDAESLKGVKVELNSILNSSEGFIKSSYRYYNILNLFGKCSLLNLDCNFSTKVASIFWECEKIIDYMLNGQLISYYVDSVSR